MVWGIKTRCNPTADLVNLVVPNTASVNCRYWPLPLSSSVVPESRTKTEPKRLQCLQRLACISITGAILLSNFDIQSYTRIHSSGLGGEEDE
ncbi:hypothetical protein J6590_084561, partial [Homalodisca vitripennis]